MIDEIYLPQALSLSVPYNIFYDLSPRRLKPFGIAFKNNVLFKNRMSWIQGIYFQQAIASALSSKNKYPTEPIDLFGEEKSVVLSDVEQFELWATQMNRQIIAQNNNISVENS